MILIVGAGLAGLSTAYHLSETPYRLYEREMEVGGLCRSYRKDGFTFDYTGHLLHFRQPQIKALVERLLAGKLQKHTRKSFIYSHHTYTEYPFQVNTHGLPPEVVRDCLMGFIATLTTQAGAVPSNDRSFKQWIVDKPRRRHGQAFMVPFNEKLGRCRWLNHFRLGLLVVPKPNSRCDRMKPCLKHRGRAAGRPGAQTG